MNGILNSAFEGASPEHAAVAPALLPAVALLKNGVVAVARRSVLERVLQEVRVRVVHVVMHVLVLVFALARMQYLYCTILVL